MTGDPTCIHCRIAELINEEHPDGRITTRTMGRVAQVVCEIVATHADAGTRKAVTLKLFREMAEVIEDHAARLHDSAATPPRRPARQAA